MPERPTSSGTVEGKHVFIAYRVNARDIAQKIAWYLERNKVNVWFFPWKVGWADSVTFEEEKGINDSFAGLIVFTPDFLEGRIATEEYRALAAKRRRDKHFKLGVLRVNCSRENVPPFLEDYFDVEISSLEDPRFYYQSKKILRGILGLPLEPSPSEYGLFDGKNLLSEILSLIETGKSDQAFELLHVSGDDLDLENRRTIVKLCCDLIRRNKSSRKISTDLALISTIDIDSSRILIKELAPAPETVQMDEIIDMFRLILSRNVGHARNLATAAFDEMHWTLSTIFLEDIADIDGKVAIEIIYSFLEKYTAQVQGWEQRITKNILRIAKPIEIAAGEMHGGFFSILADSLGRFFPESLDEFTTCVFPCIERILANAKGLSLNFQETNRLLMRSLPTVDSGLRQLSLAVLSEQGFHEIVPYAGELLQDSGCMREFLYRIPLFLDRISCACCVPYLDSCCFVDDYRQVRERARLVLDRITLRLVKTGECKPQIHKMEQLACKILPSALQHDDKFVRLGGLLVVANYMKLAGNTIPKSENTTSMLIELLSRRRKEESEESLIRIVDQILNGDHSIEWKIEPDPKHFPTFHLYKTLKFSKIEGWK